MDREQFTFLATVLLAFFMLSLFAFFQGPSKSPTGYVVGDLTAYPEPFRIDEYFQGVLVVGEHASASDSLAAARLAKSLQYDFIQVQQPAPVSRNSELKVEGEQFRIETPSDFLEGSEALGDVLDTVTAEEFSLLAGGILQTGDGSFPYKQYLHLTSSVLTNFLPADDVPDDPDEIPELYLQIQKNSQAYEYELVFTEPLELESGSTAESYAYTNLEGRTIDMFGSTFYILDAEHPSANSIVLTLVGGHKTAELREGESASYEVEGNTYEITAEIVDDTTQEVKFIVNGEPTKSLGEGETAKIDEHVEIGIVDVLVNQNDAFVQFLLDSQRFILRDDDITTTTANNPYEIAGDTISHTDVEITGTDGGLSEGATTTIESISVSWTPNRAHYLLTDERLSDLMIEKDALFTSNWDIIFTGFETADSSEVVALEAKGSDEYLLKFENVLGELLKVPLFYDNSGSFTRFGNDEERLVMDEGTNIRLNDYFLVTSDGDAGRFSAKGRTHLLSYEDYDPSESVLTLRNRGANADIEISISSSTGRLNIGGTTYDVQVNDSNSSTTNITVDLDNDGTIESGDVPMLVTKTHATVELDTTSYASFIYTTKGLDEGIAISSWSSYGTTTSTDSFNITVESTSDGIDIASVLRCLNANYEQMANTIGAAGAAGVMTSCFSTFSNSPYPALQDVGNEDRQQGFLTYGHLLELTEDRSGPDELTIAGPEQQMKFLVYLADRRALLMPDTVEPVRVERIIPGTILTGASEADHQIVIGGPCSNEVAAFLMPNQDCAHGFKPGEAIIKRFSKSGKEYLLVAGHGPKETDAAITILENHDQYELYADGTLILTERLTTQPLNWEEYVEETIQPVEEQQPVVIEEQCELPSSAIGEYQTAVKKLAIKVKSFVGTEVTAENNEVAVTIRIDEPFTARFGIDWLDQNVHILKGSCSGQEIALINFLWEDGSQEQTKRASLQGPGCYCMRFTDEDMAIDDAKIFIEGGKHQLEFGLL